eukprot:1326860-Rhodomonas_salina.5
MSIGRRGTVPESRLDCEPRDREIRAWSDREIQIAGADCRLMESQTEHIWDAEWKTLVWFSWAFGLVYPHDRMRRRRRRRKRRRGKEGC